MYYFYMHKRRARVYSFLIVLLIVLGGLYLYKTNKMTQTKVNADTAITEKLVNLLVRNGYPKSIDPKATEAVYYFQDTAAEAAKYYLAYDALLEHDYATQYSTTKNLLTGQGEASSKTSDPKANIDTQELKADAIKKSVDLFLGDQQVKNDTLGVKSELYILKVENSLTPESRKKLNGQAKALKNITNKNVADFTSEVLKSVRPLVNTKTSTVITVDSGQRGLVQSIVPDKTSDVLFKKDILNRQGNCVVHESENGITIAWQHATGNISKYHSWADYVIKNLKRVNYEHDKSH
jgi:hypothetical protein